MLHEKVTFSRNVIFWPKKKSFKAFKRFPSTFYQWEVCMGYTYSISALKSGFSRIGGLFMIYLEIREKIKSILKKLQ